MTEICIRCKGSITITETLLKQIDGKFKIKGTCPLCSSYIRFVKYAESKLIENALDFYYRESGNIIWKK